MSLSYADQFIRQAYTSGKKEFTQEDIEFFNKSEQYSGARKLKTGFKGNIEGQLDAFNKALADYIKQIDQKRASNKAKGEAWELGFRAGFFSRGKRSNPNFTSQTALSSSQELNINVNQDETYDSLMAKSKALINSHFSEKEAERLNNNIEQLGVSAGAMMREKLDDLVKEVLDKKNKKFLGTITYTIGGMGGSLSFGDQLVEVSSSDDSIAALLKEEIGGGRAIFDNNIGQQVAQIQIENKMTNPYTPFAKTGLEDYPFKWSHVSTDDAGFYNSLGIGAVSYRNYLRNSGFWHRAGPDSNFKSKADAFLSSYPYSLGSMCLINGNINEMIRKTGVSVAGIMSKQYTHEQQQRLKQLKIDVNYRYTVWLNSTGTFSSTSKINDFLKTVSLKTVSGSAPANKAAAAAAGSNYSVKSISESFKKTSVALTDTTGYGDNILLQAVFDNTYDELLRKGLNSFSTVTDNVPLPVMSVRVFMGSN